MSGLMAMIALAIFFSSDPSGTEWGFFLLIMCVAYEVAMLRSDAATEATLKKIRRES
jgi:hypothetical protein